MENKYKVGEVVCERIHPIQMFTISRFLNGIYYVKDIGHKGRKDLVFLETEIKTISTPADLRMEIRREWHFSFHFPTLHRLWKAVRY